MLITLGNPNTKKPVVRAIQSALDVLTSGQQGEPLSRRVFIHSYDEDFVQLWNEPDSWNPPLTTDDLLIVIREKLDGPTSDLPEVGKYLTALDWAVWFCLKRVGIQHPVETDIPTIILVELNAPRSGGETCDADRFFQMFEGRNVPLLPWIKTVQTMPIPNQPCSLMQMLQCIGGIISKVSTTPDLSMIRQTWQSFFLHPTRPSDNHALANVLGAGLLTGDFGTSPSRIALKQLMQTLGLLPASNEFRESADETKSHLTHTANRLFDRLLGIDRGDLELLLVDDAADTHDWARYVGSSLGLRPKRDRDAVFAARGTIGKFPAKLRSTQRAEDLLDCVAAAMDAQEPLRWHDSTHPVDVLFLDLRLFETSGLKDEAAFFRRVLEYAKANTSDGSTIFEDWPRYTTAELQRIEQWCIRAESKYSDATREDSAYIEALTMLPRLTAIVDRDLPIVLFSSTQRRQISEVLRPFGNIITQFSKPALQMGQTESLIQETAARFQQAVTRSLEIVHARRLRRSLLKQECSVYWHGHVEQPADATSTEPWNVQLLLDESERDSKLTVGGFLAIYPPGVLPGEINESIYAAHPQIREGKGNNRSKQLGSLVWDIVKILEQHQVLVVPIALTGTRNVSTTAHSQWFGSDVFRDEMVGDNFHRELMRCLIELGVFVFARQVLPESASVEVSFHAPTRVLPVDLDEANSLNKVWGVRSWEGNRGDLLAFHMESSSARPLLEEVLRLYRGSTFEPTAVMARAFGLSDDAKTSERQSVNALHYLADGWLYDHSDKELTEFNQLAIEGDYGPKFSRLLEAHRCLAQGDVPNAIAIGADVAMDLKPTQHSTAVNSVLVALQAAAGAMTGPECVTLVAILERSQHEQHTDRIEGVVRKILPHKGLINIESGGRLFTAKTRHCKTEVHVGDIVKFQPRRGNRIGSFLAYAVCHFDSDT